MTFKCRFCNEEAKLVPYYCSDMNSLQIMQCTQCSLVQTSSDSHINDDFYASDTYFPSALEGWRLREQNWNRKRVALLKKLFPNINDEIILDFGSGAGGFLEEANFAGLNVIGFDLSKRVVAAHQSMGWQSINSLDDVPSDTKFLTLFHVLEHIPQPWNFLSELVEGLPSLETIIIEVPNEREALNTIFKNENYLRNRYSSQHLYYFSEETLRGVIDRAGMKIIKATQLQRYSLANNMGWLNLGKGGGQDMWNFLNDLQLNDQYERVLVDQGIADSLFFVCGR